MVFVSNELRKPHFTRLAESGAAFMLNEWSLLTFLFLFFFGSKISCLAGNLFVL